MILKNIFRILIIILEISIFVSFANSICLNNPTSIKFLSGSNSLGNIDYNSLSMGNVVYARSDIDNFPLSLEFNFENIIIE